MAEAELEADVRTALRKIYYGSSGDAGDKQGMFVSKGPSATLARRAHRSRPVSPVADRSRSRLLHRSSSSTAAFAGRSTATATASATGATRPQLSTEHVTQPALFIAGTLDPVLRFVPGIARLSDLMDRWFDDLRGKVLIEGAGHWIQQERVEETNRALLEFLKGL